MVILTCTNISQEDIIHYCGTWYGSHCGGSGHMFVDPWHILDDMESNGDDENEHLEGDDQIIEFDGLMNMEQNDFPMGAIVRSNDTINSSTPMERALAQLVTTMQKITIECKKAMWHFVNMPPHTWEYWHVIFVTNASQRQMQFYT